MILSLTHILFSALLLASALMLFSRTFWLFSLFTEVVPQFTVVALFCALLLLLQRRFLQSALLCVVVTFLAWPILTLYVPAPTPAYSAETDTHSGASLLTANVNRSNTDYEKLLDIIEAEQPDIILLQEVTSGWSTALVERLGDAYPYQVLLPNETYKGMAVFSSIRMTSHEVLHYAPESSPILRVTFADPALTVFNIHTLSPVTEQWTKERDGMVSWLAPLIRDVSGPVIVAGDFNMTITNPLFRAFLASAGLSDARQGYGWQPSWERGTLMTEAIDHVLYREAEVRNFNILQDIGSDHWPVMSEIQLETPQHDA